MADYNPNQPHILGQEYVPIRDENFTPSPSTPFTELGDSFTTLTANTLSQGRFYVNAMPSDMSTYIYTVNVYPRGQEDQTGPIRSVVIPVDAVALTGATTIGSPPNGATALFAPTFDYYYFMPGSDVDSGYNVIWISYDTASFAAELTGKRILGVNVLLGAQVTWNDPATAPLWKIQNGTSVASTVTFSDGAFTQPNGTGAEITRIRIGEIAPFNATALTGNNEFLPWTYADLGQFDSSSASRIYFSIGAGRNYGSTPTGQALLVYYSALEVVYCEEKRVAVGGASTIRGIPNWGANVATMRSWQSKALNPSLAAGAYTVTVAGADLGDALVGGVGPVLNATRELYDLASFHGVQVNRQFPPEDHIGDFFTAEQTVIIPQLTLHTSGGPITEQPVYGRQGVAQIWGANTATQKMYDNFGASASYPWVRFYARRFGDTTQSLVLTGATPTVSGSSVSITPTQFDSLEELVDGWKEISLTFTNPPTMGTNTGPSFTFSSSAETSGNRWEILAAVAPALSGVPPLRLNLAPSPHQLGLATYEAPSGTTQTLTWMPQGVASPYVSGATSDPAADAAMFFSINPPTVTNFVLTVTNQPLTGAAQKCGSYPTGIPSVMQYMALTWTQISSATIPQSGFGWYEIQRMDPYSDWATIMTGTAVTGTSFNDYEARVGILTSYRIRAVDSYGFYGAWSSTVTGTITAPGVTVVGGNADSHYLLFSTNSVQSGLDNVAYSLAWTGNVSEDFSFPESGFNTLQLMYGKDFYTVFRSTERGGARFNRDVLIQAAAISPLTIPDAVQLRNTAFADLPYVCVRDEDGNRWFANVTVTADQVQLNRTIYQASIEIVEVTGTPSEANPWS